MAKEQTVRHNGIPIAHTFKPTQSEVEAVQRRKTQEQRLDKLEKEVLDLNVVVHSLVENIAQLNEFVTKYIDRGGC